MTAAPELAVPLRSVRLCSSEAGELGLDERLRQLARGKAPLRRAMGALAGRLVALQGWERLGYARLRDYATERLGLSARSLQDFAYVDRALGELPRVEEAFVSGELSWSKLRLLARVATANDEGRWLERARVLSVRALEREVRRVDVGALENGAAESDPEGESGPPRECVRIRCSRAVLARWWRVRKLASRAAGEALPVWVAMDHVAGEWQEWQVCASARGAATHPSTRSEETAHPFFMAPRPIARFFRAVLCSTRRQLERRTGRLPSEGEAFGWMLDHALATWAAEDPDPRRAKRLQREHAVYARDGWRCTVPGCTSYRNLHDHHIRFRSAQGSDALWNRTTLCAYHHQRGVHAGVVGCTGRAPERLRFELGLRAGQPPLAVYRSGDVMG